MGFGQSNVVGFIWDIVSDQYNDVYTQSEKNQLAKTRAIERKVNANQQTQFEIDKINQKWINICLAKQKDISLNSDNTQQGGDKSSNKKKLYTANIQTSQNILDISDNQYVILGAGPFGLLLSLLLSSNNPSNKILLIDNRVENNGELLSVQNNINNPRKHPYNSRFYTIQAPLSPDHLYYNLLKNVTLQSDIRALISGSIYNSNSLDILLDKLLTLCRKQQNIKTIFSSDYESILNQIKNKIKYIFDCTGGRYNYDKYPQNQSLLDTLNNTNTNTNIIRLGYGIKRDYIQNPELSNSQRSLPPINVTNRNHSVKNTNVFSSYLVEITSKLPVFYNEKFECMQILCGSGLFRTSHTLGGTINGGMILFIHLMGHIINKLHFNPEALKFIIDSTSLIGWDILSNEETPHIIKGVNNVSKRKRKSKQIR